MKIIISIISLIILVLVSSVAATQAAVLTFKSEANVPGDIIYLGDVSDITDFETPKQFKNLSSIPICAAPPPAEAQILSLNIILSSLRVFNVDMSQLKIAGPTQILVRREHDIIPVSELQQAVARHIATHTGWPIDSFLAKPPKNLRATPVPIGKRIITVETFPGEDFCGSVLAYFSVIVDGKPYSTFARRFEVERYVDALIAAQKIPRGYPVSASGVRMTKIEQSRISKDSFHKIEDAAGLIAARTIQPGTVLNADLLDPPPIVRKGDLVPAIYGGRGFRIMTTGEILEDGSANTIVSVRLPTKKIVKAVVLDSKTLRIQQ